MATKSSDESKRDGTQRGLFAPPKSDPAADELLVLCALGDFQRRGKILADRSLPIDRLRGALRRQAEQAEMAELSDERFAEVLSTLGARVQRVPSFVAKHPFRVTIPVALAERASATFDEMQAKSA